MQLVTTKELRDFLKVATESSAKKMAARLDVKPISFGVGRSLGDRYILEEIKAALLNLRDGKPKSQTEDRPRRRKKANDYFKGSYKPPKKKSN